MSSTVPIDGLGGLARVATLKQQLARAGRTPFVVLAGDFLIIVAVTHLAFDDDRRLAQRFPQIDLVIGGHEHFPIATTENRTLISKAGSDAR